MFSGTMLILFRQTYILNIYKLYFWHIRKRRGKETDNQELLKTIRQKYKRTNILQMDDKNEKNQSECMTNKSIKPLLS